MSPLYHRLLQYEQARQESTVPSGRPWELVIAVRVAADALAAELRASLYPQTEEPQTDGACGGFQWVGQSFASCEGCGQPYWEHDYDQQIKPGSGPFDDQWSYVPITDEQKAAVRAKWGKPLYPQEQP